MYYILLYRSTLLQERVPTVLHLRFQAELNQMESIQEAERQLNQLNEIRTVVDARNDAATMASYAKVWFFLMVFFCVIIQASGF